MSENTENTSTAAKIYADALIELAQNNKIDFEILSEDLKTVYLALEASRDLRSVMENPAIDETVKTDIIKSIFWGKVNPEIVNFLKILVNKKRITEFPQIYAEFKLKLYEINNIQPVTVISAVNLQDNQKQRITNTISEKLDKTILPEWILDKSIIAGLIVKINDNVIDMSIKNRIGKLSKSLMLK